MAGCIIIIIIIIIIIRISIAPYLYALGANNSRVTIKTPQVDR